MSVYYHGTLVNDASGVLTLSFDEAQKIGDAYAWDINSAIAYDVSPYIPVADNQPLFSLWSPQIYFDSIPGNADMFFSCVRKLSFGAIAYVSAGSIEKEFYCNYQSQSFPSSAICSPISAQIYPFVPPTPPDTITVDYTVVPGDFFQADIHADSLYFRPMYDITKIIPTISVVYVCKNPTIVTIDQLGFANI